MKLDKVVAFLDRELRLDAYHDDSHNGLQVGNGGEVTRVCCGVDASLPFFEAAADAGANLLICHHGLSWGDSLKRITGLNYRLIRFLVEGEPNLHGYNLACQLGTNAVFAGHYATERFGVIAVGELLRRHFKLPSRFVDLRVPY